MKKQVTLTIDSDILDKFKKLTKKAGSNVSVITNMYFASAINTGRLQYYLEDDEPVEMGFIPYEKLSKEDKNSYNRIFKADKDSFINI